MRVYILQANYNNYQNLVSLDEHITERYRAFNGTALSANWPALRVGPLREGGQLPSGDLPGWASHIPVFSQRAASVLQEMLVPNGELLPLVCEQLEEEYVAFNVTRLADALDEERSMVKRYKSSGRIMRILRYEFVPGLLDELLIFKLPPTVLQDVYVTEGFVEHVLQSDLRGFVFKLVWSGEDVLLLCPYCMGIIDEKTVVCPTCGLDVTCDAAFEMSWEECAQMKRIGCRVCATRIFRLADPCPYCGKGEHRQRVREGSTIVV